ncbi:MAG: hypothetical protein AAF492_31120, partial [Verrucomicrobiota bacterium]
AERDSVDGALLSALMQDADARVRRAAADAMSRHVAGRNAKPLVKAWEEADLKDTHLIHTVKLALRELFRNEKAVDEIAEQSFSPGEKKKLVEIAVMVSNQASKRFLSRHAEFVMMDFEALKKAGPHMGSDERFKDFMDEVTQRYQPDLFRQYEILGELNRARDWFVAAAPHMLTELERGEPMWLHRPLPAHPGSKAPWGLRERTSQDGKSTVVIDSIVNGETRTGLYRSHAFTIPEQLSFWMCGHNGYPNTNPEPVNHIRLVLAESGEEVVREVPPRHDTARKYTWDLKARAGQTGRIEIVDADAGKAYAWIGVGRFEPPVVRVPEKLSGKKSPAFLKRIGALQQKDLYPRVSGLIDNPNQP